ncbi:PTS system, glucose-specific IIA component [Lachnospiraceae bacterium KM106-2]|nr:PTS system, glucose-specific IIA component [Lachnospiraceae bacterium KM106-2]
MDAKQLARNILNHLGGADNIEEMIYCSNRLRFKLTDPSKVRTESLNATDGVMEFITRNGMFQVVVSKDIEEVYRHLKKYYILDSRGKSLRNEQTNLLERACLCLSYIFMPILPILLSAGLVKVVLTLLVSANFVLKDGMFYYVVSLFLQIIFRYYPLLIALSAAQYYRCNRGIAIIVAAVLLHSERIEESASIFAILVVVYLAAKVEYLIEQILDQEIFYYFRHLIVLAIMIPIALLVIGPIGSYAGYIFALGILSISQLVGFLVPAIIGFLYPILIFFGMQYGIMDISTSLSGTLGIDSLIGPGLIAAYIAQGVAAWMAAFYIREKKVRNLGILSGVASFGGVVEPGILGINLRLSKPLFSGMVSGGVIGLLFGLVGIRSVDKSLPGVLTLFAGRRLIINVLCILIAILIAALITYLIEFREVKKEEKITYLLPIRDHHEKASRDISRFQETEGEVVYAPLQGRVMPLAFVNDSVYAQETMGKGVAILPEEDILYAPLDGEVMVLFEKGNGIGIQSEEGAEIFIHIGINTSAIEEELFHTYVKIGDSIKKGDRLIQFDRNRIKDLGYDMITPISICNCDEYVDVISMIHQDIKAGSPMTKLVRRN